MTDRYQRLRDAIAVLDNPPAMKRGRLLSVDENMNARIAWDDPRDDFHLAADPDTIAALLKERDQEKSRADSLAEQVRHDYARIAALLKERDALLKDAERLDWLADNLVIEGFVAVAKDVYEFATDAAEKEGREEPAQSDQRVGLRLLIDAALADGEASNAG